jgi:hypothetical protein
MARRAASYGKAALHMPPDGEALLRFVPQYEATSLGFVMNRSPERA